jgi:TPP-dependent pyruvate/acetoin dehydrogenase alpha subunit
VASRLRALEERIINLVRSGEVKIAIWGAGEEIHCTATALALSKYVTKGFKEYVCQHPET